MNKTQKGNTRRHFLKSAASLTGAALLPSMLEAEQKKEDKIIYRTLGKTGIKVPIISMGCAFTENAQLVASALDKGITHLDTAYTYQNGKNEVMIGEIIKDRPRKSLIIGTKIPMPQDNRTGHIAPQANAKMFTDMFEQSLKRLKTDYVDILLHHDVVHPSAVAFKPVIDVMTELKKQGKARAIGISTHQNEPAVIRAAVNQNAYDIILTAYNFRQPHREEVKKSIAYAAKAGLGIIAMKTMAGVYWDRERKNLINATAALKWVLNDSNVHTAIPGIMTFDQLESDITLMSDIKMTPRELADLKLTSPIAQNTPGLYCAQCNTCRSQCRHNLDIPAIMRSYMYAYGYQKPSAAKDLLSCKIPSSIACQNCTTCLVSCPSGFDVQQRINDITRILTVPAEFLS